MGKMGIREVRKGVMVVKRGRIMPMLLILLIIG
jgi:hypothetical protein